MRRVEGEFDQSKAKPQLFSLNFKLHSTSQMTWNIYFLFSALYRRGDRSSVLDSLCGEIDGFRWVSDIKNKSSTKKLALNVSSEVLSFCSLYDHHTVPGLNHTQPYKPRHRAPNSDYVDLNPVDLSKCALIQKLKHIKSISEFPAFI